MKVGVVGLGLMGFPIASSLHNRGHEVFSWTQRPRTVPWFNSTNLSNQPSQELDFLVVASGNARPSRGGVITEIESTYDLVSNNFDQVGARIIYLSSGAVYGECIEMRSENDSTNPSTEYGLAKSAAEYAFLSQYEQNSCSLRIGNVVDWNSPYGLLQAMKDSLTARKIVFQGNPTDCRDYISIQDLTLTVSRIVESNFFPNFLNVGSGVQVQLGELANLLKKTLDREFKVSWREGEIGQLRETRLDITKLKSVLGVLPTNPRDIFSDFLSQSRFD